MKRKIILILVIVFTLITFTACERTTVKKQEQSCESMFVIVEDTSIWRIVYHKDTRVMYAVSDSGYNYGNFTLLVDADGNPLLWDGRSEK